MFDFEIARDVGTVGHAYELSIPVCRSELGRSPCGEEVEFPTSLCSTCAELGNVQA